MMHRPAPRTAPANGIACTPGQTHVPDATGVTLACHRLARHSSGTGRPGTKTQEFDEKNRTTLSPLFASTLRSAGQHSALPGLLTT